MTGARRAAAAAGRVVVCAVLYAALARALAMGLGIWAAGSFGVGTTLLLALVCPIWMFVCLPSWLAWRVLHPLGGRVSPLVRAGCWLSPLVRARELRGLAVFVDVDAGRALPRDADLPADAWTALAAVREAERLGDAARARRIGDALAQLPPGPLFPWMARRHGVERLVAAALRRGDVAAAAGHARLGAGALCALLRAVGGDAADGPRWRRGRGWLLWAAAPCRTLTWPLVRGCARRARLATVTPPLAPMLMGRGAVAAAPAPALRHLQLVAAAAEGSPVSARAVFALAADWDRRLDEAACARLHARALALGARQGAERARAVRDEVIAELAALAARADGLAPPEAEAADGAVSRGLRERLRAQVLERVGAALAPLADGRRAPPGNVLAAWERWLAVRSALERAESFAGTEAVVALWFGGVRDAVWAWGCALYADRRARSGWAAHMMFSWIAERAELYGDFPATLLNRENARSALAQA